MGRLVVADDVHQLQVVRGEQQAVEVRQVDVAALAVLHGLHERRDHRPLLLDPVHSRVIREAVLIISLKALILKRSQMRFVLKL